ncbi:MAG TPA: aromatic amino acid lyase [Dongiaceae bacterium]|jgi:histidine ammonia-lyase|nr:aromatic amino acid lyase [Dongiaceae bacterium]
MTVVLSSRADLNLDNAYRVAWRYENVRLSDTALRRIADCRETFLRLIDSEAAPSIYGVTTAMGELASHRLGQSERDRHARLKPFAAATSFGNPLPQRVARAIVFARLANFIEGHAATSRRIAEAVAAMLDGGTLPAVPGFGQGGAGEILALYPLFAELSLRFDLDVKERGSLINGSPCAAGLLADSVFVARRRLGVAEQALALSIEAFGAPLEHYDEALDTLWGDEHEAASLRNLRRLLPATAQGRRNYQAPVSYRIVPRVLGHAHRALAAAERAAAISLSAVSDNPVYLPPTEAHPLGRCLSTGGFHNAMAAPALDDLAAISADLCLLCHRHATRLLDARASKLPDLLMIDRDPCESDGHGSVGYIPMAMTGYLEQARAAAQRTLLAGTENAGSGQDDVTAPAFLAWDKQDQAGRCLDAALAMLAVLASQALHVTKRDAPQPLRAFLAEVREIVRPVEADRVLGPELGRLAERFTARVTSADV